MITGGDLRQSRLDVGYKTFTISPCLLFFVRISVANHACIGGGSLLYQVGLARMNQRSILRDAVQDQLN